MFLNAEWAFWATEPENRVAGIEKPRFNGVFNDFRFSGLGFVWIWITKLWFSWVIGSGLLLDIGVSLNNVKVVCRHQQKN